MRSSKQFLTGLLLAAATALVWAAPPRLTGQGQAQHEAMPLPTLSKEPTEPAAAPTPEAVATAPAGSAEAPAAEAAPDSPVAASSPATEPAKPKKSGWAAFWDLFRRNSGKSQQATNKQPEHLVNTEEYHEPTYELLEQGDLHRFEAGYRDPWRVHASNVMCLMSQTIPDYGYVEFRQGVGQPLVFTLHVAHPPAGMGKARIRSEAPRWQHYAVDRDLGELRLAAGERAVIASSEWSRRLLLELSEGMQPVMRYWDAADATDDMEVALSAINFRGSLALFHNCLGQLQRYDIEQVKRTVVNFNEDSSRLSNQALAQLQDVMEIYRNDKRIRFVDLEVYTSRSGMERYDFRLATRRTRAIRDYFIKQGIDESKLMIQIHTKQEAELKALGYRTSDVLIALRYEKPEK